MRETPSVYCSGPDAVRDAIGRLRPNRSRIPLTRIVDVLATAFERWLARGFADREAALAQIAASSGWSRELLDESIDALLAPFTRDALISLASTLMPRARLGGFIMPGNAPGAGMHELVASLLAGSAALIKTSQREPHFFAAFMQTLRAIDPGVGSLLEVISFGREREDLSHAMLTKCDFVVALGDDASIAHLSGNRRIFGFGSRTSGALISLAPPANVARLALSLARDVVLFEQQGCLSPHHVFVADADLASMHDFTTTLCDVLISFATTLPGAKLSFNSAAAIRRLRERARWRSIGGHPIELFEGGNMSWTMVLEPDARFTLSPGYRCVTVSAVRDHNDLAIRVAPVAGRLEAFALSVPAHARARFVDVLAGAGVTYVCDPGKMQSPPVNWPHGGGAFLDFLAVHDE